MRLQPGTAAAAADRARDHRALDCGSPRFAAALRRILAPETLWPLRVQRTDPVRASEVFHDPRVSAQLREHCQRYRAQSGGAGFTDYVRTIHAAAVAEGTIPEALTHPDQTGAGVDAQARVIHGAAFLKAIAAHPDTTPLESYRTARAYLLDVAKVLRAAAAIDNRFRSPRIKALVDTAVEAELVAACFGVLWPPGVDLYSVLGALYPAFHARMTGHVPLALAERLDDVFETPLDRALVRGLPKMLTDARGRYLGVYPMVALDRSGLTTADPFVAQDQIGRRAIVLRVFDDIVEILTRDPQQIVVLVDYAGGSGNLSELLIRHVYGLAEPQLKARLLDRVRVVVVDGSQVQLDAGRARVLRMAQEPGLAGVDRKVFFFRHDICEPLHTGLSRIFRPGFDPKHPTRPVYLGMTSYSLGALDSELRADGRRPVPAVAETMFAACYRIYAVDFSSPMWRIDDFLRDTGSAGQQYLRLVHARASAEDARQALPLVLQAVLRARLRRPMATVADYIHAVSLGPGLASHYLTVWPHLYGHCSGYAVQSDDTLRKPHVLEFAERLLELGAEVHYRSKVFLSFGIDVGPCRDGRRAWFLSPGRVADFVVAQNNAHAPDR